MEIKNINLYSICLHDTGVEYNYMNDADGRAAVQELAPELWGEIVEAWTDQPVPEPGET